MRNKLVYKVSSWLSILLAVLFLYTLASELSDGIEISEINPVSILVLLIVIVNAVISVFLIRKRIAESRSLFILQIFILVPMSLLLYNIFFNSTISCT